MRNYELTLVLAGDLTGEQLTQTVENVIFLIQGKGGLLLSQDVQGKRALLAPINNHKEGLTMTNRLLISIAFASAIVFSASASFSQQHEMQNPPAKKEGPGATDEGMQRGSMMGMMHPMMGMQCPMMQMPMQAPGGMQGGMMGGMMRGMMQGAAGGDPKMMSRMLEMRGEMLMKIGEVMMKHAKMWQQEGAK